MPDGRRILVAERDDATATFLFEQLAADGFAPAFAASAGPALALARAWAPELLLAGDLGDGNEALELIGAVRAGRAGAIDPGLAIVSLSGVCGEQDVLRAFAAGADDVVARPFSYPQLRARIEALLRRCGPPAPPPAIRIGALEIETARRLVRVGGRPVSLCRREYELLLHLAAEPQRVFGKDELLRDLWGYRSRGLSRTLDHTAGRLRRKLDGDDPLVVNAWGVGYSLLDPVAEAVAALS